MAKRRNKKSKSRKTKKELPVQQLPALGAKQLENAKFTEAIKTFRALSKNDNDKRWLPLLSQSYHGRIKQLIYKGMTKEALVIYDNMVASCQNSDLRLYTTLLLKNRQFRQALEIIFSHEDSLHRLERQAIEETFAAIMLSGDADMVTQLPDDSLLKGHFSYADNALKAYCQGNFPEVESQLQNISFRSPYKNFSLAIKGMVRHGENPDEARSIFAKIDTNSPFAQWVVPFQQTHNHKTSTVRLSNLEKRIMQSLEGIDDSTQKFIAGVESRQNSPAKLYNYLVSHKNQLQAKKLQDICERILPHAPGIYMAYSKQFGALNLFQSVRLQAHTGEVEGYFPAAVEEWKTAVKVLEKEKNPQDKLKIALICRHCVELLTRDDNYFYKDWEIELLEKSLIHDPKDRDTYFKLMERTKGNLSKHYRLINRAIEKFPDDTEVLFKGIKAALDRGAMKKASRLAAKLLKIDPINKKARELLISSHLGHGRKLASKGKYKLAIKECESASPYNRDNLEQGEIEISHGLILILAGEKDNGLALHDKGVLLSGNSLVGCFLASLEARLLQMSEQWKTFFDKNLRAACRATKNREGVLPLISRWQHCDRLKYHHLQELHKIFTPLFNRGLKFLFFKEEYLSLCALFHRHRYFDLLEKYGKAADKLWPQTPVFVFYFLYGKCRGGEKSLHFDDYNYLYDMGEKAARDHDLTTAQLIDDLGSKLFSKKQTGNSGVAQLANKMLGELAEMIDNGEIDENDLDRLLGMDDDFF